MTGFFVTGTDTEIGKTAITAGLTHLAGSLGLRSAAVKPLAAGQDIVNNRWVNEDVLRLRAAANIELTDAQVGPLQLRTPCAPHIAAELEGITIEPEALLATVQRTLRLCDLWVCGRRGWFSCATDRWLGHRRYGGRSRFACHSRGGHALGVHQSRAAHR